MKSFQVIVKDRSGATVYRDYFESKKAANRESSVLTMHYPREEGYKIVIH